MSNVRIGIVGAAGRMGRTLIREISAADGCAVSGGTEASGHGDLGKDLGVLAGLEPLGLALGDDSAALFDASDVVVDFTVPAASMTHLKLAVEHQTALVLGTTGLSADEQKQVVTASKKATVVQAANFSLGVNLLLGLSEQVSGLLNPDFDIEIVEMHHRHKVDAPSGTALALGEAAARGRGVKLSDVADRGRDGLPGARKRGDIGFAALRGGNVVGDHTVIFAADNERIELTHKAGDRAIFARGAVTAAQWSTGKPAGLYSMMDVLGFNA